MNSKSINREFGMGQLGHPPLHAEKDSCMMYVYLNICMHGITPGEEPSPVHRLPISQSTDCPCSSLTVIAVLNMPCNQATTQQQPIKITK